MLEVEPLSTIGIGSVPFVKGENACEEIFKNWGIPFWPQYPGRSLRENFVFQFLRTFPGLKVSRAKASFDETQYRREERKYLRRLKFAIRHCEGTKCLRNDNINSFEPLSDWAFGYSQMKVLLNKNAFPDRKIIKLQVTGPATIWNSFFKKRISRNLSPSVEKTLTAALTAAGLAQIQRILANKKTPLIFIDEPVQLTRQEDDAGISQMVNSFKGVGALVGLHVCSNPDWEDFSGLNLDVFHFDSTAYDKLERSQYRFLQNHLKKGKWIAWGAVSTLERTKNNREKLLKQIKQMADSYLTWEDILNRSLLAPACGMGGLKPEQDGPIFENLRALAVELRTLRDKKVKKRLTLLP